MEQESGIIDSMSTHSFTLDQRIWIYCRQLRKLSHRLGPEETSAENLSTLVSAAAGFPVAARLIGGTRVLLFRQSRHFTTGDWVRAAETERS